MVRGGGSCCRAQRVRLTERGGVDVLRREEEQIDPDAGFDALLCRDTVERILRNEQGLFFLGAVQLAVFAVLERAEADGRQRGLEDVELSAEVFLQGVPSRHQLVLIDRDTTEKGARTSAIMVALRGPVMADSTMLEAA